MYKISTNDTPELIIDEDLGRYLQSNFIPSFQRRIG